MRATWWNPAVSDLAWVAAPTRRAWPWPLVVYVPMFAWLCWPLTGLGGWSTPGIELFVFFFMAGLAQVVASVGMLSSPRTRERGRRWLLRGAVLCIGFVVLVRLGTSVRMHAFDLAGERAAPLIAAIERYVDANGTPPRSLAELVPRWIARLPDGVPPLEIRAPGYEDNAWMLRASVPSGVISFDKFVYLPKQNYPATGWGGSIERLGRWAYLHE